VRHVGSSIDEHDVDVGHLIRAYDLVAASYRVPVRSPSGAGGRTDAGSATSPGRTGGAGANRDLALYLVDSAEPASAALTVAQRRDDSLAFDLACSASAGLVVNVVLLLVLVPRSGLDLGLAGAGIALCGAYVAMVGMMHVLTRNVFAVDFQWRRLAQLTAIFAGVAVSGELLLPTAGLLGLVLRALWLLLIPALLVATRFFAANEREQARTLVLDGRRRVAAFRRGHGDVEAYAEDPLRDI